MRPILLSCLLLLSLVHQGHAQIAPSVGASPGLQCRAAIQAAEHGTRIPSNLLAAIGMVESGRPDPATGQVHPWPWTINAEGQGMVFNTKADAITAVQKLQAQGIHSIDVGCMQVNLMHHPQAFASLDEAFDPPANARYAARFLQELFTRTGTWPMAAAFYHSATPDLGQDYSRRVMAVWPGEQQRYGGVRFAMAYGWSTPVVRRDAGGLLAPTRSLEYRVKAVKGGGDGMLVRPSAKPPHMATAFYRPSGAY
jgi:Transglycosylase SLT domain